MEAELQVGAVVNQCTSQSLCACIINFEVFLTHKIVKIKVDPQRYLVPI